MAKELPVTGIDLGAPVRQLLVDLDGTLLGNKAFPLQIDFVRKSLDGLRNYGGLKKRITALLGLNAALRAKSRDVTNDVRAVSVFSHLLGLAPEEGRKVLRESLTLLFPSLERHFFPIPGAKEFLEWARGRYPMVLATNPVWPPEIVELRLRWAGVDPSLFTSITHVRRMHACKPELEYYEEILDQEKLDPAHCLLIGDDMKMDLPATRVGIRVFIVGKHEKDLRARPLKFEKAKASAWKGSYPILQASLGGPVSLEDVSAATRA
ncbi:MAG TPA: HAD family hydrolase [Bdellovibrionota bacterium]|nr:HAD family hydrolase [Bdellovibrionota bacterium]